MILCFVKKIIESLELCKRAVSYLTFTPIIRLKSGILSRRNIIYKFFGNKSRRKWENWFAGVDFNEMKNAGKERRLKMFIFEAEIL